MKGFRLAAFLMGVALVLGGCGRPSGGAASGESIKVAGSSSVAPLVRELKEAYTLQGGRSVEVQESGSTAGITATLEGASDIGMSSRDLSETEVAAGIVDMVIALDGIAVIVHPDNPVRELSPDQITAIYTGGIRDWSEVGGNPGEIIVISREEGSGTRGSFEELMQMEREVERNGKRYKESLIARDALYENSTGGVKSGVAGSKNAIGYISLGTLDDGVCALTVGGYACTEENIQNGSYPIARPFLLCTLGKPEGGSREFIDYILSPAGQAVVSGHGYVRALVQMEGSEAVA